MDKEIILFVVYTILIAIIVTVLLNSLLKRLFNIKELYKKSQDCCSTEGIIFNSKTKKLESDQSRIVPF